MIVTTKLYILKPMWMTVTFIQCHNHLRNSQHNLLELMLNSIRRIDVQERELCLCDFVKHIVNIGLCRNTGQSISFQLDMMLLMTKLDSMMPF